jgi:hypothetical protein
MAISDPIDTALERRFRGAQFLMSTPDHHKLPPDEGREVLVWCPKSKLNHFRAFRPECGVARRRHSAAMTSPRALPRAEMHQKFLQLNSGTPH